jgi:hypothetical protein
VDEHNAYSEYVNQLPDAESPKLDTSDAHNNMDQYADRVGAAVAAHLGPLLQGIAARLDELNKVAAHLFLQPKDGNPVSQSGRPDCDTRTAGAGITSTTARGATSSTSGTTNKQRGTQYAGGAAEAGLRKQINNYCNEVDRAYFDGEQGRANRAVFCEFNFKSRAQMGLEELGEVLAWVQQEWPLS